MNRIALTYIRAVLVAGALVILPIALTWRPGHISGLMVMLLLTGAAGVLKFRLPGMEGTYSLVFAFNLWAIQTSGLAEATLVAITGVLCQCLLRVEKKPAAVQVLFNVSGSVLSTASAGALLNAGKNLPAIASHETALLMLFCSAVFFAINTGIVAGVIALTSERSFARIWKDWLRHCLPFYGAGAALVSLAAASPATVRLTAAALIGPGLVLMYLYKRAMEPELN